MRASPENTHSCQGSVCKTAPKFGNSKDTAKIYFSKSKTTKGKRYGWLSQRKGGKSPLPVETHEMQLIPPATSCEHTSEMSSSLLETRCSAFLLGTGHIGTLRPA